jgi:site-specific recombinase XerD
MPASDDSAQDPAAAINDLHFRSWQRHLRTARRSELTIGSYRLAFDDLTARHPGRDITDLTQTDIQDYLIDALGRLKDTTVAIRFRSLRAFYNWAVREEILDRSPMSRLREPKVTDEPPKVLPDDDLKALLKTCAGKTFEDRRDTAIIRLFCEPGSPRVAEMAGIQMGDLDMSRDTARVHGKGNKVRIIPFGAKTGQAFDRYLRVRAKHRLADSPALWLGGRGGPMTGSGIGQMLGRRSVQAGIGHVHPHQLRHTAAHAWADSGGSEGDAQELFGWASAEMPRRYGRSARTARAHRASRRMSLGDRL